MGTMSFIGLIFAGLSTLLHLLPRKSSSGTPSTPNTPSTPSPTTPDNSSSSDAFSGWPGLPGHPLLNHLFGSPPPPPVNETIANAMVAAAIGNNPAAKAQILAALSPAAK